MSYVCPTGATRNPRTGHSINAPNNKLNYISGVLTPQDATIDTQANALLLSYWNSKFKAAVPNRWYPLPVCSDYAAKNQENIEIPSPYTGNKLVRLGKNGIQFILDVNPIESTELMKLNGKAYSFFGYDPNGNIEGICTDGTILKPRKCLSVNVYVKEPEKDVPQYTYIDIIFAETSLYNDYRRVFNPTTEAIVDWNPADSFDGVHAVVLSVVGNWSATGGVVRAVFENSGEPCTVLTAPDFYIAGKTISTAVPVVGGDGGSYTIASTGLVTLEEIDLQPTATIACTTLKLESTGGVPFTIPL
jgi:hypothetical protein